MNLQPTVRTRTLETCTGAQILTEFIQAGGETLQSEIHMLIISIWNKEELSDQWKESITV